MVANTIRYPLAMLLLSSSFYANYVLHEMLASWLSVPSWFLALLVSRLPAVLLSKSLNPKGNHLSLPLKEKVVLQIA